MNLPEHELWILQEKWCNKLFLRTTEIERPKCSNLFLGHFQLVPIFFHFPNHVQVKEIKTTSSPFLHFSISSRQEQQLPSHSVILYDSYSSQCVQEKSTCLWEYVKMDNCINSVFPSRILFHRILNFF